jgi:hypothetical protein
MDKNASPSSVKIGEIEARRGEKKTGYLPVGETAIQTVHIPLAIINGMNPGPVLCISGGVHPFEYSSVEAVIRIIRHTDPRTLSGTLLVVPVLNMPGFETRGPQGGISTPFLCPIDAMNLNRLFPGNPDGSMSYQIAAAFMGKIVAKADYYIDCHGGDINEELSPFVIAAPEIGDAEKDRAAREILAGSFDCEFVTVSSSAGGSNVAASQSFGKPSIILEAGGYGRLMEDAVQFITEGINNVMILLKMLEGTPKTPRNQKVRKMWNVYAKRGGVCSIVPLGTRVKRGDKVAEIRTIFGELLETHSSPVDGVVIFRRSPIPVSTNDWLVGVMPNDNLAPPPSRPYP